MTCINCGSETTGKFCIQCGQRTNIKRLSFREGWNDFWARIYGFDGMMPRTLRDLTLRPGNVSNNYIKGNRVMYYGPVGYFFLMITLMYLVASILNIDLIEFLKSNNFAAQPEAKQGNEMNQFMQTIYKKVSDNMKLISFFIIGIQAFVSRFIFFRKSAYNYLEHAVLPFYVQGHIYWITIASLILFSITGQFIPTWVSISATVLFTSYAYSNFFTYNSKVKSFFKGLGVYVSTQFLFGLLVGLVVILLILTNKDFVEMIKPSNNR